MGRPAGQPEGPNDWAYLPHQRRLANVAYPLLLKQGRVDDGVGALA